MSKVIVIGGGPAGMFAAIAAAENGHQVLCLKRMKNLGKSFSSPEKGGAILPIRAIWKSFSKVL